LEGCGPRFEIVAASPLRMRETECRPALSFRLRLHSCAGGEVNSPQTESFVRSKLPGRLSYFCKAGGMLWGRRDEKITQ
jgi:hypothetical protein